jgi:hypothetical protein
MGEQALGQALAETAQHLGAGEQAAAGQVLGKALSKLDTLQKPLAALEAARRAARVVGALEQVARETDAAKQAESMQSLADEGSEEGGSSRLLGSLTAEPTGAISASTASDTERVTAPAPDGAAKGGELQLSGNWNGRIIRQLFQSAPTASDAQAIRRVIVDHERVLEDRFRHDDVPPEYREAVRSYFAALHQKEGAWTQIKK